MAVGVTLQGAKIVQNLGQKALIPHGKKRASIACDPLRGQPRQAAECLPDIMISPI